VTMSTGPKGPEQTYLFLAFLAAFLAGAFLAAFFAGAFLAAFLAAAFFTGALAALAGFDFAGAFAAAIGIVLILASRSSVKRRIPLLVELMRQRCRGAFFRLLVPLTTRNRPKATLRNLQPHW
jgi:membrane protein implicated in regulation of membrane protease activity